MFLLQYADALIIIIFLLRSRSIEVQPSSRHRAPSAQWNHKSSRGQTLVQHFFGDHLIQVIWSELMKWSWSTDSWDKTGLSQDGATSVSSADMSAQKCFGWRNHCYFDKFRSQPDLVVKEGWLSVDCQLTSLSHIIPSSGEENRACSQLGCGLRKSRIQQDIWNAISAEIVLRLGILLCSDLFSVFHISFGNLWLHGHTLLGLLALHQNLQPHAIFRLPKHVTGSLPPLSPSNASIANNCNVTIELLHSVVSGSLLGSLCFFWVCDALRIYKGVHP